MTLTKDNMTKCLITSDVPFIIFSHFVNFETLSENLSYENYSLIELVNYILE